MTTQNNNSEPVQTELRRRHRTTVMVVAAFLILTAILIAIAFANIDSIARVGDPRVAWGIWIAILVFGLGAFVLRRTRFNAMRLQDIAGVRGASGLLQTLQGTTIQVACLAGAIALMGFVVTIRTGNEYDMLRAGGVAIILLIYCYPSRTSWERVLHGIQVLGDANDTPEKGPTA